MIRQIGASELRLGMYLHKLGGSWLKHPFFRSSFQLVDAKDIQRILDAGIQEVWIDDEKGDFFDFKNSEITEKSTLQKAVNTTAIDASNELESNKKAPLSMNDAVDQARKFCSESKGQVTLMFEEARLGKAIDIEVRDALVERISSLVDCNSAAILSVARIKTHDDYTYMHSIAVSALMLALAKQLNLDDDLIRLAGIGGLMHDLGKAFIPIEILTKQDKLTDEEYEIVKRHPIDGAKMLQESNAQAEVIDIVLHHHEKIDGTGYPHGLKNDEISILARMGAICDVYDAVTSIRPYKTPWDPAITIRNMAGWVGHFDKDIFNVFVKTLGIYPVGSLVRLTSQHLAVVVEPGKESLLTPIVKVFFSAKSMTPLPVKTIDLAAPSCKLSIESPENPADWKFKGLDHFWQ